MKNKILAFVELFGHNITISLILICSEVYMLSNVTGFFPGIVLIFLLLVLFLRLYQYKKIIDKKNVELVKYYLDTKFICRNLLDSLTISDSNKFCAQFMKKIIEYYYLDDIIIIDSLHITNLEVQTVLRKDITSYIRENIALISFELSINNLVKFQFDSGGKKFSIHISKIATGDDTGGFVVCVEKYPSLLAVQERNSLENSINLLKNRLFYS
jgi:hypothetical protein